MQPLDLIDTATKLTEIDTGRPREANLRRASSTIYYALFHALCRNCADALVGSTRATRNGAAWSQAYRHIQHRQSKSRLSVANMMAEFPPEIQAFGSAFVAAQTKRIRADYDPAPFPITKSQVLTDLDQADSVIRGLSHVTAMDRRAFAAWVAFATRPE